MKNDLDKKIINLLINNPGINQKQIAKKLGVTAPAINNRIQRMKKKGIIKGFVPLIDTSKFGFDITVVVLIKVNDGKLREASEKITKEKNVCTLYDITGEYDIAVIAKFKNREELSEWIKKILSKKHIINRTATCLVFDVTKESLTPDKIY